MRSQRRPYRRRRCGFPRGTLQLYISYYFLFCHFFLLCGMSAPGVRMT